MPHGGHANGGLALYNVPPGGLLLPGSDTESNIAVPIGTRAIFP